MKWLNNEEEQHIRNKIPVIIKSSLSESFSETAKSIMSEVGNRVLARLHQINTGVTIARIQHARQLQNDLLLHHYSSHLGVPANQIRMVVNEYEKVRPIHPSPTHMTPSGPMNNPNYAIEKREYDNKLLRYKERQRLLRHIKTLQETNPMVGTLATKLGDEERMAAKTIDLANPMITRTPYGAGPLSRKNPKFNKPIRLSQLYLLRADAIRKRRENRKKLP